MRPRAKISIDWLQKGRLIDDAIILKRLIVDKCGIEIPETTNPEKFESEYGLKSIATYDISIEKLKEKLGVSSLRENFHLDDDMLTGETLIEKIHSLTPDGFSSSDSLAYVLSFIQLDKAPKMQDLALISAGLDSFSAALFAINTFREIAGDSIDWLGVLWRFWIDDVKTEVVRAFQEQISFDTTVQEAQELLSSSIERIAQLSKSDPIIMQLQNQLKLFDGQPKDRRVLEALPKINPSIDQAQFFYETIQKSKNPEEDIRVELNQRSKTILDDSSIDMLLKFVRKEKITNADLRLISSLLPKKSPTLEDFKSSLIDIFESKHNQVYWMPVGIRQDSALVGENEGLVYAFREQVNMLKNSRIIKTCKFLESTEGLKRLTAEELEETLSLSKRGSFRELEKIEQVLNTTSILNLEALDLQLRFAVAKKKRPLLKSAGLVEKIHLSESDYQIGTLYVEPESSEGPEGIDHFQVTGNRILFSLRLDLYDTKNEMWRFPESTTSERKDEWIYRKSKKSRRKYSPTQREVDVISTLWGAHEYWNRMKWLLDSFDIPRRTSDQVIADLIEKGIISVVHHPILDYCGLVEGYILAAKNEDSDSLDRILREITLISNFTYGFYNHQDNNLYVIIRAPRKYGNILVGQIADLLERNEFEYIIARIDRQWTYYFTVLQRLYNSTEKTFVDPWI